MAVTTIREELKQKKPFARKSEEAFVSLLRTAELARRLIDGVIEGEAGITGQQYNVLRILRGAGEKGLTTLDIVDRLVEETPGITRLIDRLEAKELVTRERCKTDRRQVFCRITRTGLALLDKLDEPLADAQDAALATLKKKELAQLLELLDRTRDGVHKTKEKNQS
jgi:DNA-binding MarR family transcriptional regulator